MTNPFDIVEQLQQRDFWIEHDEHTRADWRAEVADQNTQLGYWDWLFHKLVDEADGEERECAGCRKVIKAHCTIFHNCEGEGELALHLECHDQHMQNCSFCPIP